jgi:beta-D-xylosidase 4
MDLRVLFYFAFVVVINAQGNFPDCKNGPLAQFPICNQTLPSLIRAADLISRLTTAEKITRLVNTAAGVQRLGLPKFEWWSEALHGVAYSPGVNFGGDLPAATSFPMPINLGASFNLSMVYHMAQIVSTEARAFNNEGRAGLVFFTPNINIFRDPRWGRGQETPGEDPFLTSQYVYALIEGLQRGEDERYLKIAADCKHYAAYDLENWGGTDRFHFNAVVSDQDLIETYLPPFETCIRDAKVASIMCSYNAVNGVPSCGNAFILETIARQKYHLDGFVVSDCGAISTIMNTHHYTNTVEDTVALALHSGTDLNCGSFYSDHTQAALDKGTIVEADIDRALERTFNVLVRLGYFDPPEQQPYRQLNKNDVDTPQARQSTLLAAQESIVLLKNTNKALPLSLTQLQNKKIALIGPSADATVLMQGNYFGRAPYIIDPVTGFQNVTQGQSITIQMQHGCKISGNDQSGFAAAIELAKNSDVVIYLGGIDQSIEAEGRDRNSIALPDIQLQLIQQLEQVVTSPMHVVIMSGSGLDLTYVRDSNKVASVIWMGYAGQSGGLALATVMFGQYNPGGRLPITFYPSSFTDAVSMFDMGMRPTSTNPGRTYKFYTGQAVFQFGDGLSYTTFNYTWYNDSTSSIFSIDSLITNNYDDKYRLHIYRVNVTNVGPVLGDDVVLGFITPPNKTLTDQTPAIRQLFGFQRVHLNVGETAQVYFPLSIQSLLTVARDGSKWLEPGSYRVLIGKQHMYTIHLTGRPARWS